ncbi:MAG: hypothetical protein NWE89_04795 [Candidatus Bathyarchaeota archaeon]|nr:hypothetical protein [Candidatus Bathyarchaeota archaeon]
MSVLMFFMGQVGASFFIALQWFFVSGVFPHLFMHNSVIFSLNIFRNLFVVNFIFMLDAIMVIFCCFSDTDELGARRQRAEPRRLWDHGLFGVESGFG